MYYGHERLFKNSVDYAVGENSSLYNGQGTKWILTYLGFLKIVLLNKISRNCSRKKS